MRRRSVSAWGDGQDHEGGYKAKRSTQEEEEGWPSRSPEEASLTRGAGRCMAPDST